MARSKTNSFKHSRRDDATFDVHIPDFQSFVHYVETEIPPTSEYVFRGHLSSNWELLPSLFRHLKPNQEKEAEDLMREQLELFKRASRGRCSLSAEAPDDEWWAYGQHYGLKTPLLDWTKSPYVALFFAFADLDEHVDWTEKRVVFALDKTAVDTKNADSPFDPKERRNYELVFVDPLSHENPRLTSQAGLFTLTPTWSRIDDIVQMDFEDEHDRRVLTRIFIPDNQRKSCLQGLQKMNIHHLSLLPDIEGATRYCNLWHDVHRVRRPTLVSGGA